MVDLHPEFSWLPRKFKIAVSGAAEDRAAIAFHDIGLKHRARAEWRERLPRAGRRRHGPHALCRPGDPRRSCRRSTCSPTSSRSCACTICMAAATTSQGAHQDSGQSARHRQIPRGRRGRLGGDRIGTRSTCRPTSAIASCPISRRPTCRRGRSGTRALDQRRDDRSRLRQLAQAQCQAASRAGLCERRHLAEGARAHAGRRQLRPDGLRCRPRRALQPQRGAGELHPEPHPAARRPLRLSSPSMRSSRPRGLPPAITIYWAT